MEYCKGELDKWQGCGVLKLSAYDKVKLWNETTVKADITKNGSAAIAPPVFFFWNTTAVASCIFVRPYNKKTVILRGDKGGHFTLDLSFSGLISIRDLKNLQS